MNKQRGRQGQNFHFIASQCLFNCSIWVYSESALQHVFNVFQRVRHLWGQQWRFLIFWIQIQQKRFLRSLLHDLHVECASISRGQRVSRFAPYVSRSRSDILRPWSRWGHTNHNVSDATCFEALERQLNKRVYQGHTLPQRMLRMRERNAAKHNNMLCYVIFLKKNKSLIVFRSFAQPKSLRGADTTVQES